MRQQLLGTYALASGGDTEAYLWLLTFQDWCHRIDDFIDEPGHPNHEVIDLCAQGVLLCSGRFYQRHSEALGPVLATVAEQYRQSLSREGTRLGDALRISGNQVILLVSYLCGGQTLLRAVSDMLWPIVNQSQLENDYAIQSRDTVPG
jgi:hypothetical protein